MARLHTCGFESQTVSTTASYGGESHLGTPDAVGHTHSIAGTPTISNSPVRSGAASLLLDATSETSLHAFVGVLDRAYFARAYVRFSDVVPSSSSVFMQFRANAANVLRVHIETDSTLTLRDANGTQVGSASAALSADTWYRIQLKIIIPTAGNGTGELYLDDTQVVSSAAVDVNNSVTACGIQFVGASNAAYVLDDVALNDDQGANQNTYPGDGKIVLLKAVSDNALGTGWVQPATTGDDVTDIFASVDNTPPLGVTHSDVDANNLFYIFNAANLGAASNYDANCQTYTDGGIDADDTITLCQALCRVSCNSATGTNNMEIKLVSNPADAGATTANAELGATAGTEPAGWKSNRGAIVYAPSPTLGTSPVVRVTKTLTGSTRVHMADLMGVIVEYVAVTAGAEVIPYLVAARR